jgi:hypothetical protein
MSSAAGSIASAAAVATVPSRVRSNRWTPALGLQAIDPPAHRRDVEPEPRRGPGELPGARDREEHADLIPVDRRQRAAGHAPCCARATQPCKLPSSLRIRKYLHALHPCNLGLQFVGLRCERARGIHGA